MRLNLRSLCGLLLLFAAIPSFAQTGGIVEGLIVDAETGEAMIGVSVMIQGTTMGAASDLDGRFRVMNIPVGKYLLAATAIGYARVTIQDVIVDDGKVTTLNFQMKSDAVELGEVVIEAKMVNNTEASLLSLQKRASAVSDGISAEQIKKSPDSDAADAVKRVTGVTVVGDKYVFVRGMGERYNNTRLNGATIASPEPLKRVVPFDILPANLLDNIVVHKTFTPDQPGDFAGGSVQLNTKEFPEKLTFSASSTLGYNDQSSLEEFMTYRGGNKDWLGIDDARCIPDEVNRATQDPLWQTNGGLQKTLSKAFSNTWEPRPSWAPFNGSRSFSLGNQIPVAGKPLGYLLSFSHSGSYSRRTERQYGYTAASDTAAGTTELLQYQDLSVDRSAKSVNWGGILDLNYRLSDRHKIGLKSLYTRSADDEARIIDGVTKEDRLYRNYRLTWTDRSVSQSQLRAAHELPRLLDSRLEWSAVYSRATYNQPDRRDLHFTRVQADEPWQWLLNSDNGFRRFGEMDDDVYEVTLDWSMPMKPFGAKSSRLKLGGLYRTMDRKFDTRKFYNEFVNNPDRPLPDLSLPPELLLSDNYIDTFFVLKEITRTLDSYEADMTVGAGYMMTDLSLHRDWRMVGGIRIENTNQHFETYPYPGSVTEEFAEGGPKHTDIMPSVSVTYKVNENLNLRAAGSMTIANPDYAELVPTEDDDYFEGATKYGNPDLKHTKIFNADLRAEHYPTPGENVSLGLFYKSLQDPIEMVLIPSGATERLQPQNLVDAYNIGAEFEFRKSLAMLSSRVGDWASYFSVIGNLTLISSNVVLKDDPYDPRDGTTGLLTNDERPLMGQSEYVINTAIAFEHPGWGNSARLLFNTFGKRISQVGGYGLPDTYEQPFDKIDIACSQRLGIRWTAKFQATNLLNSEVKYQTGDKPFTSYKVGRTFSLGLSYTI